MQTLKVGKFAIKKHTETETLMVAFNPLKNGGLSSNHIMEVNKGQLKLVQ